MSAQSKEEIGYQPTLHKTKIKLQAASISIIAVTIFTLAIIIYLTNFNILGEKHYVHGLLIKYSLQYKLIRIFRLLIVPSIILFIPSVIIGILMYDELASFFNTLNPTKFITSKELIKLNLKGLILPIFILIISIFMREKLFVKLNSVSNPIGYFIKTGWFLLPLLVVINNLIIFSGYIFKARVIRAEYQAHLKNIEDIQIEKLRTKTMLALEEIDNKYLQKLNTLSHDQLSTCITYDNTNFKDIVKYNDKTNPYSLVLKSDNSTLYYDKSKKHIVKYTNDEKTKAFKSYMDNLQSTYNVSNLEELDSLFDNKLNILEYKNFLRETKDYSLNGWSLKYLDKVNKEYLQTIETKISLANDMKEYFYNRINYLKMGYLNAKAGTEGEERINKELDRYSDEFINIPGKTVNLSQFDCTKDKHLMECDNIVIAPSGVFILETKNKGEKSASLNDRGRLQNKYTLRIEAEGRWVNIYPDGSEAVWSESPTVQNRTHIINIRNIINSKLGLTREDEGYINPVGIIVIANDILTIDNQSDDIICRVSKVYDKISDSGNTTLSKAQMLKIKEILDDIKGDIHSPNRYNTLDVYSEIKDLDSKISNSFVTNESLDSLKELELLTKKYLEEVKNEIIAYNNNVKNI